LSHHYDIRDLHCTALSAGQGLYRSDVTAYFAHLRCKPIFMVVRMFPEAGGYISYRESLKQGHTYQGFPAQHNKRLQTSALAEEQVEGVHGL
jgi:hypothetical protein